MPLHVERHDRVALLTLDDPERRNALTRGLVNDIVDAMDAAEADEGVGAIVVTGAGPAFCSGADLGDLQALDDGDSEAGLRSIYEGFLRVLRSPLPTVAAVNGPAVGAGFNLALAGDVRLCAPEARFDARFLRIGLHPGGGHTWLLERAVGPEAAAAIVLFGERVTGEDAPPRGLAWRCVPPNQLVADAIEFAGRAAAIPPELIQRAKSTLRAAPWQPSFDAALATEVHHQMWSISRTQSINKRP